MKTQEHKITNTDGTYQFFSHYNNSEYIESHDKRPIISIKDKGESRNYVLKNPSKKETVVYKGEYGIASYLMRC